jgi:FixJ family two-component response regulator
MLYDGAMESLGAKIAIIDDDEIVRRALRRLVDSLGYRPVEYCSGEAFFADPFKEKFLCVVLDLHMPVLNGIDVLAQMRAEHLAVPTIIITGGDEPKMRERCIRAGAAAYMVKPVEREAMLATIQWVGRSAV